MQINSVILNHKIKLLKRNIEDLSWEEGDILRIGLEDGK
jgi:hypothetical protein